MIHPRISLHQVAFLDRSTPDFIRICHRAGIANATLVTPLLATPAAVAEAKDALTATGVRATTLNHVFGAHPDLDRDDGRAAAALRIAIDTAATLGASAIYLLTGGRGALDWEQAAARFAALIAPCIPVAEAAGVRLLVENANLFNADIHIAHTLADTIRLVDQAGVGVCLDIQPCWAEAGLAALIRRAAPLTGLVQVSDYVLGDRATPCRAVPGDGAIPLQWWVGELLATGYAGLFDLELVGPRIVAEGAEAASLRAARWVSETLVRLGI